MLYNKLSIIIHQSIAQFKGLFMENSDKVITLNHFLQEFVECGLGIYANQKKHYKQYITDKIDSKTASICFDEDYFYIFNLLQKFFKNYKLGFDKQKLSFLESSEKLNDLAKIQLDFDIIRPGTKYNIHVSIVYQQIFHEYDESFLKSRPTQITISVL